MKAKNTFYKNLFSLVIPIALQNLLSAAVSASDAVMLGFLDQNSLSAVSLATQISFVLSLFYAAFTIGATILAAQYWGKKDVPAMERVLGIALQGAIAVSILFALAALFIPDLLMRIYTNEKDLISLGIPYLRIVSISYLCMGISQVYLSIMKNSGRTKRSTLYGSIAVVLNLILNAVFIFGLFFVPAMGIAGAALATSVSRIVELALVLIENHRTDTVKIRTSFLLPGRDLRLKELRIDFNKHTAPVLANELVWGCGFTMFSVIMGHLGNDAVAANSIAGIVKNLISCFCMGIAAGSGIIVGNELGAGELERAKEYGGRLVKLSVISGVISGLIIFLISPFVLNLNFGLSTQAKEYLKYMLYICSYYMIGKSINSTTVAGIFCAGGDTRFGLFCDTIAMWFIIIPLGLISAFVLKLPVIVVYFLLNLDEFIKLPAVYYNYKKYKWVKNLTR